MKKSILIIGAGEGVSFATAEKFGKEGFTVGLINRDPSKAESMVKKLTDQHITAYSIAADAMDDVSLAHAITDLKQKMGTINVLLYNAAALKEKDILEVTSEEFMDDFKVNVGAALKSVQISHTDLKENNGAILLTGGGFATHPSPAHGTLSIGKAGIRNLALQLNERFKEDGIYVGTLTITAMVTPTSTIHNPNILAQTYWEMYQNRTEAEVVV